MGAPLRVVGLFLSLASTLIFASCQHRRWVLKFFDFDLKSFLVYCSPLRQTVTAPLGFFDGIVVVARDGYSRSQ
jgi:hypothetical protein